jgi:hypothetical protein
MANSDFNSFMELLDVFRIKKFKEELQSSKATVEQLSQELASAQAVLKQTEALSLLEIQKQIEELQAQRSAVAAQLETEQIKAEQETKTLQTQLNENHAACQTHMDKLQRDIEATKKELVILDEAVLLQSFGFYKTRFNYEDSGAYKTALDKNADAQAKLIKEKSAATCPSNWTVDGDRAKGEKMVNDFAKLLIRAFNNECDASVAVVKYNNVDSMEKRIRKAFDSLNKLGERMHIALVTVFLNLKLQELYLTHEYQVAKQNEREEQKRIREQIKEEARIQREIEELKSKLIKEERHFDRAMETMNAQLEVAKTDAEKKLLEAEIQAIAEKKAEVEEQKKDVLYREQNTRAGYVYIISNLGAFGEHVYKIGVTRRLDPEERVDELGDASVPFCFDVHALIFSDDAPALENALHKAFHSRRLNAINHRKEFFRVTLDEIEEVVRTNFSKPVEFMKTFAAEEYRQSLMFRETDVSVNPPQGMEGHSA